MYEPMQAALDLMVKVYDIPSGRHLLYDEKLKKEMEAYTDGNPARLNNNRNPNIHNGSEPWMDSSMRRPPQSKPTIEGLSTFMKE